MNPLYCSLIRPRGDLAGVVQRDREAVSFYLFDDRRQGGKKVVGALHIASNRVELSERDLELRWSADGTSVALFIRGELWAAFVEGEGVGGYYEPDKPRPSMPAAVLRRFEAAADGSN